MEESVTGEREERDVYRMCFLSVDVRKKEEAVESGKKNPERETRARVGQAKKGVKCRKQLSIFWRATAESSDQLSIFRRAPTDSGEQLSIFQRAAAESDERLTIFRRATAHSGESVKLTCTRIIPPPIYNDLMHLLPTLNLKLLGATFKDAAEAVDDVAGVKAEKVVVTAISSKNIENGEVCVCFG
uniref:Uncharacterized protein n=1 Tax=Tanacetum cinerariifolium TaxID=118510 RepID=A0A699H3U3_TANCI|nr:hypothetical protein [Tanacetum cinerariifolium]